MPDTRAETSELFDLTGRVALLTGAAGLIGPQLARALNDYGAAVALTDTDGDRAAAALVDHGIGRADAPSLAVAMDVTDAGAVVRAVEQVTAELGPPDILVNCAAFTTRTQSQNYYNSFEEYQLDDWQKVLDVNLTGTFLCCQTVGRGMVERGRGSIINVASLYGVVSPDQRIYDGMEIGQPVPYSVSKAGVLGLTRYLSTYWAARGVRVNAITPGGVYDGHEEEFARRYSARTPMGRMADRTELRGAVVYLASEASAYCTGHNLVVDGGWTVW